VTSGCSHTAVVTAAEESRNRDRKRCGRPGSVAAAIRAARSVAANAAMNPNRLAARRAT
jgi:hypothetical protein